MICILNIVSSFETRISNLVIMIKIGQKFLEEREKKGLTLEEVSKATKIKVEFLRAIEKGEYNKLPSKTYAHGFVKNYIDFLGLPKKENLALFRREFDEDKVFKVLPGSLGSKEFSVGGRFSQGVFFIVSILIIFIAYILFQYRFAILPPPLEVSNPKKGAVVSSSVVIVSGITDPNATVFINEIPVTLDQQGYFEKKIDLFSEKSTIEIKSVNRFGKETVVNRHIEVQTTDR